MIATNTINKGLYLSIDPHAQPPGTVVRNHNGQFLHYDDGNFAWKGAGGNKIISATIYQTSNAFSTLNITIMDMTEMAGDIIIIGTNESTGNDYIGKLVFSNGDLDVAIYHHIVNGEDLELSVLNPMRQFFAVYETEKIQRVYWNDGVVSPRSLNIVDVPSPISAELLNFTPPSDVGIIEFYSEGVGNLYCASYSFVFRLLTSDGAITDYSMPILPVNVTQKRASGELDYYKQFENQGDNYTVKSEVGISLKISDIDTRYDSIQVVAFRSIAKDVYEPGVLIFDQDITSATMYFTYTGSENLGTVTSSEVNIFSKFILQAQLMEFIKNVNTLADYTERTEIPEGTIIKYNKINGVTLDKETYPIPLDTKVGMSLWDYNSDSLEDKPLHGVKVDSSYRYKGVWYKQSGGTFVQGDGITAKLSTDIPHLRIKKYTEFGGTVIYKDISLQDDYLNYRSKKVSHHLKGYMGTETYRIGVVLFKDGKPYGVRYIGDREFPVRNGFWEMTTVFAAGTYTDNHIMGNVLSLIVNNLDLSELVTTHKISGNAIACDIDGFAIVRCERDVQLISQGALIPMLAEEDSTNRRNVLAAPSTHYAGGGANRRRLNYLYNYYSPEHMFNVPNKSISIGDKMRIHAYTGLWFSDNSYFGPDIVGNANNWAQKYYGNQSAPGGLPADLTENDIRGIYNFPFNSAGTGDTVVVERSVSVRNESETPGLKHGYGTDSKIVVLTTDEPTDADSFASWKDNALSIVDHYVPKTNLYGGTSDAALAANKYFSTGHYQEITLDILNSIKDGNGDFIFNGIQVFGGDTYINIFDIQRILRNQFKDDPDFFGHTTIFPIQSTVNIDMRNGIHSGKDRPYHSSKNPTGVGLEDPYILLEDFNYNDGYSTSLSEKYYLPLPYGYKEVSESKFNVLWSNEKIIGEKIDNYRIFPVNNIRPVEHSFGFITGLINSKDKLVYLQEKGVGYIPVGERVTINSQENQPVQLGVGGQFSRYDTTNRFYGCQHYYSIRKVPGGIVWFDFNNRAFVFLKDNMQLSDESIIKGMEPYFNALDPDLKNYDIPFVNYGIYSYYDKKRKEAVMIFREPDGTDTALTFSQKNSFFTGTLDLIPSVVYSYMDYPIMSKKGDVNIWVANNANQRSFFGTSYDAYLKFIVNNDPDVNKIYDVFKVIGNNNFFNDITYTGKNFGPVTENVIDNSNNILSEYLKYLNFEWRGSYPLDSEGERLRGHYAEIEFKLDKNNSNNVELFKMITGNRKTE
jgi:hypothetical protein